MAALNERDRRSVSRFPKPVTCPLQDSNTLSSLPCSLFDTIVNYASLSMASDVCCRCCLGLIVLVGKIEVEIECRVYMCPNVIPVLVLSNLYLSVASLLSSRTSSIACRRPVLCRKSKVHITLYSAMLAEPVAGGHTLQPDAVSVPQLLTSIAEHQNIIVVIFSAGLTLLVLAVVLGSLEEHGRVEFGHLGLVLDGIGRYDWPCGVLVYLEAIAESLPELASNLTE